MIDNVNALFPSVTRCFGGRKQSVFLVTPSLDEGSDKADDRKDSKDSCTDNASSK